MRVLQGPARIHREYKGIMVVLVKDSRRVVLMNSHAHLLSRIWGSGLQI